MRELLNEVGGVISVDATSSSYTFIHVFAYSRMVDFGKVEERGKADMARPVTKEMELASRQYWLRHD
jgi:hypothetical protein